MASGIKQRASNRAGVQRDRPQRRHALPAAYHGAQQRGPRFGAVQLYYTLSNRLLLNQSPRASVARCSLSTRTKRIDLWCKCNRRFDFICTQNIAERIKLVKVWSLVGLRRKRVKRTIVSLLIYTGTCKPLCPTMWTILAISKKIAAVSLRIDLDELRVD